MHLKRRFPLCVSSRRNHIKSLRAETPGGLALEIFDSIRVEYFNFLNLYGRCVIRYESFLTIFSLYIIAKQIEVKLVAITIEYFLNKLIIPRKFFANTPFKNDALETDLEETELKGIRKNHKVVSPHVFCILCNRLTIISMSHFSLT